jgi:hypothetical protein
MAKVLLLDMKLLTADFTKGKDIIVVNKDRQIAEAKKHAMKPGIHNRSTERM